MIYKCEEEHNPLLNFFLNLALSFPLILGGSIDTVRMDALKIFLTDMHFFNMH